MTSKKYPWLLLLLLPLSFAQLQAETGYAHVGRAFKSEFQKLHRKKKFNGVVLVAHKGRILYQGAMGFAGPDRRPLKIDSVFNLASVSKQFTALAILMLAEKGRLGMDDPVSKHLPRYGRRANWKGNESQEARPPGYRRKDPFKIVPGRIINSPNK